VVRAGPFSRACCHFRPRPANTMKPALQIASCSAKASIRSISTKATALKSGQGANPSCPTYHRCPLSSHVNTLNLKSLFARSARRPDDAARHSSAATQIAMMFSTASTAADVCSQNCRDSLQNLRIRSSSIRSKTLRVCGHSETAVDGRLPSPLRHWHPECYCEPDAVGHGIRYREVVVQPHPVGYPLHNDTAEFRCSTEVDEQRSRRCT